MPLKSQTHISCNSLQTRALGTAVRDNGRSSAEHLKGRRMSTHCKDYKLNITDLINDQVGAPGVDVRVVCQQNIKTNAGIGGNIDANITRPNNVHGGAVLTLTP